MQILENVVTLCLERKQYVTLQCITHHKLLAIPKGYIDKFSKGNFTLTFIWHIMAHTHTEKL